MKESCSNHYYLAHSGSPTAIPPTLGRIGVEDAGPPPHEDADVITGVVTVSAGTHSVAADPVHHFVYVPAGRAATICNFGAVTLNARDALPCSNPRTTRMTRIVSGL